MNRSDGAKEDVAILENEAKRVRCLVHYLVREQHEETGEARMEFETLVAPLLEPSAGRLNAISKRWPEGRPCPTLCPRHSPLTLHARHITHKQTL